MSKKHKKQLSGLIGIIFRGRLISSIVFLIVFSSIYFINSASAEINAEKLSEVLSQLSGDNVSITQTGTETQEPGLTATGTETSTSSIVEPKQEVEVESNDEVADTQKQLDDAEIERNNTEKDTSVGKTTTEVTESPILDSAPAVTKPSFEIVKVENGDKKVTISFKMTNESPDISKFEFTYINYKGERNKSLTFEKDKIKDQSGNYIWYIPNLDLTKYTISIAGINSQGEKIEGIESKTFVADLSLLSAGKCYIPDVSGLRVSSTKEGSVLYWNKIPEAVSYKIYTRNSNGVFNFITETKDNFYNIHLDNSVVKYEQFSIKGVCADGTESAKFILSTKVRTGPQEIIIGIISLLLGYAIVKRRKILPGKS